jgi:choline dehydrogenase-like flavoprotein
MFRLSQVVVSRGKSSVGFDAIWHETSIKGSGWNGRFTTLMLIDLDQAPDRTRFESSVCIVGGGIAGLLLAHRLATNGIDVHLLEAGGPTLESRSQELYRVEMEGRHHHGATEGRFRVFGGSSTMWGGQLLPYTPDIFSPPSGTPSAPWPLTTADIEPHYAALEKIMHVSSRPLDPRLPESFDGGESRDCPDIRMRFSKWAPFFKRNLARTVGRECLENRRITVFLHANVTSIEISEGRGVAERVIARNYSGKSFEFRARHFVVCAGTIESCRLLLASRSVFPGGIGNTTGQLGRYFHDHISVAAATVTENGRQEFLRLFSPSLREGTLHTPKLEASAALRSKRHLLAVMAHFAIEEPEGSGMAAVRDLLRCVQHRQGFRKLPKAILNVPRNSAEIVRALWDARVRKRRAISDRASITLRLDSEQLPSRESRIRLSAVRDPLGMPRAIVDWRISEEERRSVQVYAKVVECFLNRVGVGPLAWRPELWEPNDAWLKLTRDTFHPMGGTRMGRNPSNSVVDPYLQVHGVSNLFVASCSVFPGGGSSNPTFTLMALTLRLATHLTRLCGAPATTYRSETSYPMSEQGRRIPVA